MARSGKDKKIIYYSDPINDEFAENITKKYQIKDNHKYIHKNIFFRFFSFILYHFIAIPILFLIVKIKYHIKIYGKKNIKTIKKSGYFVYMNHSQNIIDAVINQVFLFSKKGHLISHNDVYSLKGLKTIVNMLGCMPTPNNMIQSKNMFDAIKYYVEEKKNVIVILPEAHIWPYYNDIRPFLDSGFIFPSLLNKPIVVTTVVYRERKIFKHKRPYISLYVSNPIYPKEGAAVKENQIYLRDEAYNFMKKMVTEHKSYEYIIYKKKEH